jgi:hypothetical protein
MKVMSVEQSPVELIEARQQRLGTMHIADYIVRWLFDRVCALGGGESSPAT